MLAARQLFPPMHIYPGAQPDVLRSVHVVPQLFPEHANPLQDWEVVDGVQIPLPSHFPAGVTDGGEPPQDGLPQVVPDARWRQ